MGVEIERKFLVADESWRAAATSSTRIVQGYLAQTDSATVRVRVKGERGFLTIKGVSVGIARSEYEYEIPSAEAAEMLDRLCERPLVEKTRYAVPFAWNSLEHYDTNTRLLHYTDMDTQPWVSPDNRWGFLWLRELRLMIETGALTLSNVRQEIDLGSSSSSDISEGRK